MVDVLIIGGGPAGLSAAVTAKARNKDVLLISNDIGTSALYKAEKVVNYLGMPYISGKQMLEAFAKHAKDMNVASEMGKVQQVLPMGEYFAVSSGDTVYEAKAIILATGKKTGAAIKGEKEFLGKGLSYCATCDGMLYKGKTTVITGDNEEARHDALFLSEICKKVYFITNKTPKSPPSETLEIMEGRISSIDGDAKVRSITVGEKNITCDGVFIIADSLPTESLIHGIEMDDGYIKTSKNMKTNINGVFAAGDCTGKPLQISKAAGDGLVAALSAVWYLEPV